MVLGTEQAVIVNIVRPFSDISDVHNLENELATVFYENDEDNNNNIGVYDGHDIATDFTDAIFYM